MDEKSKQKPAPSVFPKKIDWLSFIKKPKKNLIKKSFMNLWISKEFPLKFKELFPILDYLSNGNLMLSKLNEVLNTQANNFIFPLKFYGFSAGCLEITAGGRPFPGETANPFQLYNQSEHFFYEFRIP